MAASLVRDFDVLAVLDVELVNIDVLMVNNTNALLLRA